LSDLVCRLAPRLITNCVEYPEASSREVDFASQGCSGKKCEVGEPVMIVTHKSVEVNPWRLLLVWMLEQSPSQWLSGVLGVLSTQRSFAKPTRGIRH